MFTGARSVLQGKALKKFEDPNAWHNLFRTQVYARIDEESYRPLFDDKMGAPNASVSLLVGMMILKEAYGWSDHQLFEQCSFNLLVRSALGLTNLDDKVPADSTYYLFRKRVYEHREKTGEDLLQETFAGITSGQITDFEVNGDSIRMDSVLLGSNVAYYSRYEVVHRTLARFYGSLGPQVLAMLADEQTKQLEQICGADAQKTVYRSTSKDIQDRLETLGILAYKVLLACKGHAPQEPYDLLERVFNEHYKLEGDQQVQLRAREEISSESVQSPDDPDCTYRHKGDQKVKGYSVNVTETSSDQPLNLITDARVEKANVSDVRFVEPAIEACRSVTGQRVEKVYADGAYQSPENDATCQGIDMVFTGMQGPIPRYDIQRNGQQLLVSDTQTGETWIAQKAKKTKRSKQDRYYIITKDKKRVYFGPSAIRSALLRKQLQERPLAELHKRNNVEATVFQLVWHLRNKKSKYRTLFKQQMWANCRCLWVNFVRIVNYVTETLRKTSRSLKKGLQNGWNFEKRVPYSLPAAILPSKNMALFFWGFYIKISD